MKRLRGIFFLLVGGLVLTIASVVAMDKREFLAHAMAAEGNVVSLNAGGAHPNIQFVDSEGRSFSFPEGGWISGYRPQQRVRVLYLRDDPEGSACLDDWGAIWFAPTLLAALGLAHAAAGLFILRRKENNDAGRSQE